MRMKAPCNRCSGPGPAVWPKLRWCTSIARTATGGVPDARIVAVGLYPTACGCQPGRPFGWIGGCAGPLARGSAGRSHRAVPGNDGAHERHGLPVSLLGAAAVPRRRRALAGGARGRRRGALRVPPRRSLALDLRRGGARRALFQCFRGHRPGLPEDCPAAGSSPHPVGGAVRRGADRLARRLPGARHPRHPPVPARGGLRRILRASACPCRIPRKSSLSRAPRPAASRGSRSKSRAGAAA